MCIRQPGIDVYTGNLEYTLLPYQQVMSMSQPDSETVTIHTLLDIMRRLRDPEHGCPWDQKQDFLTIAPYTLEEAYEVVDAIERNDRTELRDELGDLLFQVVFHAQMAQEAGWFDFSGVLESICEKLVRRHPHVFADEQISDAEEQTRAWEKHKERERKAVSSSVLDGIPLSHTALTRAGKIQKQAAKAGFDWPDIDGVFAKIAEELDELREEIKAGRDAASIRNETGDLLFSVVNLARHAGVDPESALRQANSKFIRRFRNVERQCRNAGSSVQQTDPLILDNYWERAKREE
jgi:MazG family protein